MLWNLWWLISSAGLAYAPSHVVSLDASFGPMSTGRIGDLAWKFWCYWFYKVSKFFCLLCFQSPMWFTWKHARYWTDGDFPLILTTISKRWCHHIVFRYFINVWPIFILNITIAIQERNMMHILNGCFIFPTVKHGILLCMHIKQVQEVDFWFSPQMNSSFRWIRALQWGERFKIHACHNHPICQEEHLFLKFWFSPQMLSVKCWQVLSLIQHCCQVLSARKHNYDGRFVWKCCYDLLCTTLFKLACCWLLLL